jgi:Tfp pilus assembly protein PilX
MVKVSQPAGNQLKKVLSAKCWGGSSGLPDIIIEKLPKMGVTYYRILVATAKRKDKIPGITGL